MKTHGHIFGVLSIGDTYQCFMPPPKSGWPPEIEKWEGGDLLKYPGDDKMGQFLGHFCIYEGSQSQNFRALRAQGHIYMAI